MTFTEFCRMAGVISVLAMWVICIMLQLTFSSSEEEW